jgi:uncharacterized protein (DUF362 family)
VRAGDPCDRLDNYGVGSQFQLVAIAGKPEGLGMKSGHLQPSFSRPASPVAIRKVASYSNDFASVMFETLQQFKLDVRDKNVLLKPNFVAFDPHGFINTHPVVIEGAREAFRRLGAKSVMVGDGPALERDVQTVLESVCFREFLGDPSKFFADLNLDDVQKVQLKTHASRLRELCLPKTLLRADFVVSMAKLKTHHWAGVTLSLKNMFGVVPGGCYGWPKNVLHWAGIDEAILDLNSTVGPDFAIVDGIVGMEGNGPSQGTPRHSGVLVFGSDPVAVDATCTRVMGLIPERIRYLRKAAYLLGHVAENKIQQIGESLTSVRTQFEVLPQFATLRE